MRGICYSNGYFKYKILIHRTLISRLNVSQNTTVMRPSNFYCPRQTIKMWQSHLHAHNVILMDRMHSCIYKRFFFSLVQIESNSNPRNKKIFIQKWVHKTTFGICIDDQKLKRTSDLLGNTIVP